MNPFIIKTPEKLKSEEAVDLFVDVFTDYEKINTEGHTFVLGPRGIGKSMIFRYLEPDCQCLSRNVKIDELEFLGIYIPLKNASFTKITEIKRFDNNASQIINEHLMSVFVLQMLYKSLSKRELYNDDEETDRQARNYYYEVCKQILPSTGDLVKCEGEKVNDIFAELEATTSEIYKKAIKYIQKLAFTKDLLPYDDLFLDYLDYVIPLVKALKEMSIFTNKKVFFLIDDAHFLTKRQTYILNYWVSTRTSGDNSLKISSQYNYKSYYTVNGATIDPPHDYSEIDMLKVYTSKTRSTYVRRIYEIVGKRLKISGIDTDPKDFFPPDIKQEEEIKKISQMYLERYDQGKGRGNKKNDDSIRYSRPDFIKRLLGESKSGSTYSYAGFSQLVHLSSGITRSFIETAHKMYAEEEAKNNNGRVIDHISASIQNSIVRDDANHFLFYELPRYAGNNEEDFEDEIITYPEEDIDKLFNLIIGLGGIFREILISDRSERRVFSVAISDKLSKETSKVLNLGVQLGYFHRSTIGKKDSMSGGRTDLYILNRRLSPIWTLDPTSFAGYLFVQNKLLEEAMDNPSSMLRRVGKEILQPEDKEKEFVQLSLFQEDNEALFQIEMGGIDQWI